MAEDITLKVVTETKGLQEKINNSSLSKEDKSILSAKLSEALNLLGKGANASSKDLSIASGNIRKIIDELVKASAGAKGVSKELITAQKALEAATKQRDALRKERSDITKTKINNEGKLRTSEANRLATAANVTNDRGDTIKSYQALVNAADKGNLAAKQALENITRTFETYQARLTELNTTAIPNANQAVKSAAEQVAQVEQTSPETSTSVQMQEFGNELQNLIDKLKQMQSEAPDNGGGSNKPNDVGVDPGDDLKKLGQNTTQTSNSLGKAFKQFSIYAIALRSIKKAAHEAVSTIKELDRSLTEQAMVTGKTRKQTYALLTSYQELAAQTGATTREVAGLATQFMRQGKTTQDALTLTKAAMDAAKVAGISAGDSVNYLTTALNGFQMSAQDALLVSDKFASIAANAATSYDEIATALSKVASQANLAGMSIDYTTALLAKGLETTREAPETMGTALKTVIARMREISDYGETLGGDTDVNNVESQLAYVGIALRDANGELRSTEAVLDELGKKWTELNSNQQAAVAKALAGTRQQSRLIAMMTDYERVVELQQISERSAGATLAQMESYLEGMDAALNRVSVAWEKIVTTFVDNEIIIGIVNGFANVLDNISAILENSFGMVAVLTVISAISLTILGNKINEMRLAKMQRDFTLQQQIAENKSLKIASKTYLQEKKIAYEAAKVALQRQYAAKAKLQELIYQKKQQGQNTAELEANLQNLNAEISKNELTVSQYEIEQQKLAMYEQQSQILDSQSGILGQLKSGMSGLLVPVLAIWKGYKGIAQAIGNVITKKKQEELQTKKNTQANTQEAGTAMAGSAGKIPYVGWIIAAGILIAMGIAAGTAIAALTSKMQDSTTKAADEVNTLSSEIYKLEAKARALENVTDSYAELDNQIIKTQKDQEKMNELLDQAADKLDEEEQKAYKSLATNEQRIRYLEATQSKAEQDANQKRQEQLNKINKLSPNQRADFLDPNSTDSDVLTAQSAIYAINNAKLYDFVDGLEDAQEGVEKLAQSLLSQLSPAEALAFANASDKIEALVKKLNNTAVQVGDKTVGITGILTSDDYSVVDKVNAYREALEALDGSMRDAFETVYSDIGALATFNNVVLEFIDNNGISVDNINAIGKAIQKLGYDSDEATYKLEELFNNIAQSEDIREAIYNTFGDISDEDYKKFINAYQSAMGTGVLNMGQNIEGLKKTINSFYEKAQEWNEMSDSEKTSFLADNAELFEGPDGQKLLEAIKSGDYNFIQNALGDNKTLKDKVAQQIKDIDNEIAIENAKLEADRDYAYIAYLEEQKKLLQDSDNLYAASLDVRLEQEKKYLDEYKQYLEDQRDALKESLDKRKEAYSDYFEAVNQQADDEDFENKENTLIANISKLSTSGSADAINQQAKLEQELAQLEKERLEELRQRAQDSVMENIDKTIEDIDQKFDELLNSQQALLAAMTGELDNPTEFLSNLISNKVQQEGLTELGLESYIRDLQSTYGSVLGNGIFDNMSVEKQGDQLVLNIAGTEVVLSDGDQQSIYTAIMTALQQVGLR